MKNIYIASIIIFLLTIFGCQKDNEHVIDQKKIDDRMIQAYIAEKEVSAIKDPAGFYYEILQSNPAGTVVELNNVATVFYKISLLDGSVLEARLSTNSRPLKFLHAWGGLIPEGINQGINLMRTGEKFRFIIPSHLGLGNYYSLGYIGPNEILIADVELLNVETPSEQKQWEEDSIRRYLAYHNINHFENYASGVHKYTVTPGNGPSPVVGRVVRAIMARKYLDDTRTHSLHSSDTVSIYLPKGENDFVPGISRATEGLKEGLLHMNKGELAVLLVPSHMAFGGKLIEHRDAQNNVSYSGSIQVFPQKFRNDYVQNTLDMQNIYPLTILKYEIKLLDIYMVQ